MLGKNRLYGNGLPSMLWCGTATLWRIAAATDQLEPVAHDFRGIPLLTVLIGLFSGADTPFDVRLASLAKIFSSDFCRPREECNAVPLGALLAIAVSAIAILQRQIGRHLTQVFTYRGKPVKQTNTKAWRKALEKAGITDLRWHIQSGTSRERLQEMGGWESVEMVRRYAHMAPEHLAEDSAKIESILEKVCPHGTNTSQPHIFALPKKMVTA